MPATTATLSIRFGVLIAILLMGLFGLAVALITGERYRALIREQEQQSLTALLAYEIRADLNAHFELQRSLLQHMASRNDLRRFAQAGDRAQLKAVLNDQFRQRLVSSRALTLVESRVLTSDFALLARSSAVAAPYQGRPACWSLIDAAHARTGLDRLKLLRGLCEHDHRALASTLVPLGGIRPFAYLQVIADPSPDILGVSDELQTPAELVLRNGNVAAKRGDWSDPAQVRKGLDADYPVRSGNGTAVFNIHIYRDERTLIKRLAQTRTTLISAAITLMTLATLLSFLVLRRTVIKPLAQLTTHVQRMARNRHLLGEQVALRGGTEIRDLSASFNDMSEELAQLYRELENMAFSDPLTRLPNRAWFYDSLHRLASLTQRGAPGFALLFLDLDRFKAINDKLGHRTGDEVLKLLSARIINVLRGGDYLARFRDEASDALARMGGDEFAILLPSVQDAAGAERVAQKVIAAIERPMQANGHQLQLGTSIGIALFPVDAQDVETLVHNADLAMYHAKQHGAGFTRYSPELNRSVSAQPHHEAGQPPA